MDELKISLVDFIPECLSTGFKHGKLSDSQKELLETHMVEVKEIMSVNQALEIDFEPYLCFLRYLDTGNFKNKYDYELCLKKAIKSLK